MNWNNEAKTNSCFSYISRGEIKHPKTISLCEIFRRAKLKILILIVVSIVFGCNDIRHNLQNTITSIINLNNSVSNPIQLFVQMHNAICINSDLSIEEKRNVLINTGFISNKTSITQFTKSFNTYFLTLNINHGLDAEIESTSDYELSSKNITACETFLSFVDDSDLASNPSRYFYQINNTLIGNGYISQGKVLISNEAQSKKTMIQKYDLINGNLLTELTISPDSKDHYYIKIYSVKKSSLEDLSYFNSIFFKLRLSGENLRNTVSSWVFITMIGFSVFLMLSFTIHKNYLTSIKKLKNQSDNFSYEYLLDLLPEQLQKAERELTKQRILETTLEKAGITEDVLTTALHVVSFLSDKKKAIWISKRINARGSFIDNFEITRYQDLRLSSSFPLNIHRIRLYLPDKYTSPQDALKQVKTFPDFDRWITLILGRSSEYQSNLYFISKLLVNKLVAPQGKEVTRLLLSPKAEYELAEILSNQLSLQLISPYRISGGVKKESIFFGRTEMINHIINRDPANYLVVGGRQMGKSSLLKALERHYDDISVVTCYYQSLSSEVLIPRLAAMLNFESTDKPEVFATQLDSYLHTIDNNLVFLIDEADRFIKHETNNDYQVLNVLRRLSEEGRCTFILAGFWQLYQHAVLDYQSPIRNFAEILHVGALEEEACYQLATEPMKSMNLRYADKAIVEILVETCGQRANLIAIACQHIVSNMHSKQRIIEEADVHNALHSDGIRNALAGWVLGETENEAHYDMLVVYATVTDNDFSSGELIQFLQSEGVKVNIGELDRTLARLELAYILGKNQSTGRYSYRVPLFIEMMLRDDPLIRLEVELG